jgi:4-amino-4-deoxychorismate lyase
MNSDTKSPSPLVESICIQDGLILALPYHQSRLDAAQQELGWQDRLELSGLVQQALKAWQQGERNRFNDPTAGSSSKKLKCRVLYGREIQSIEIEAYKPRAYHSCAAIEMPSKIDYHLKWSDRGVFDQIVQSLPKGVCPLICQHGWLTDALHANIALLLEGQWYTPDTPLLRGTMRQQLIDTKKIRPFPLRREWLSRAEKISLINALNPLEEQVLTLA